MRHRISNCSACHWPGPVSHSLKFVCRHPLSIESQPERTSDWKLLGTKEMEAAPPAECPLRRTPDVFALAPGRQVFRLELPISSRKCVKAARARKNYRFVWAPTMNEYSGLPGWQKAKLRNAIDEQIVLAGTRWDGWQMGVKRAPAHHKTGSPGKLLDVGRGRRRIIRVTRYSRQPPDEPSSCDSCGGKIPLDRLVAYGVLVDDSARWCLREASWEPAAAGEGRVVVEVFEMLPLLEEQ